ncbi:hypothetical protein NOF55_21095 [Rhizobiaceae bacterium BDR2-2]|uniref:Uncharacterized protein n=1 Tax=Ectorhizobium quercum TaxID=2965071 RepID=A0AAE3N3N8_9HYPH|nr:hypothetical protein [Ectorhizobium quercum]MCX8999606.1 hypothetical protein [Ectorhizobium quercum]
MMHKTPRRAVEDLFRVPDADRGSNAEKLQNLRKRLQLRKRELRVEERQQRLDKRTGPFASLS